MWNLVFDMHAVLCICCTGAEIWGLSVGLLELYAKQVHCQQFYVYLLGIIYLLARMSPLPLMLLIT